MELTAWVDESGSNATLDPGTYIMAAAITEDLQLEAVRQAITGLLLAGQVKLHWRDERARRQRRIAEVVAACAIEHLVVVTTPHPAVRRPERRRRLTLEVLLLELARLGVGRVVLESRGPADDNRDREMLDHLRRQRLIATPLQVDHLVGRHEPMLWVPDAVCGVVTNLRCGNGDSYSLISHRITLTVAQAK